MTNLAAHHLHLVRLLDRLGWQLDELHVGHHYPTLSVKCLRNDGRWLWAKIDQLGRCSISRFHRETWLGQPSNTPGNWPQSTQIRDDFLGRTSAASAGELIQSLADYIGDNALRPVNPDDLVQAWIHALPTSWKIEVAPTRRHDENEACLVLHDFNQWDQGEDGNLSPFGRALHAWLNEDEQIEMLPSFGWVDGGCLVLSQALRQWSLGELGTSVWQLKECSPAGEDNWTISHYCAKVPGKDVHIDGEGLFTHQEMLKKLNHTSLPNGIVHVRARFDKEETLLQEALSGKRPDFEASWHGLEGVASELARKLHREFGPYRLDVLGLDMLDEPTPALTQAEGDSLAARPGRA